MQPGTLAEEWRERSDPHTGATLRSGPYFKHQVWRDGRNHSRRVPASEAPLLRQDIDNAKRFAELTDELAQVNIEHTLQLRAAEADSGEIPDSKKNSKPKRKPQSSQKPKPSLPRPNRK
jgi:hypothetical protein